MEEQLLKLTTENLFLLEFLVDSVKMDGKCDCDTPPGENCVSFKFLDNDAFEVCEADFSPSRQYGKEDNVKSGKSCLFSLTPQQVHEALQDFNVTVTVFKKMQPGWLPEKIAIGSANLSIENLFAELIRCVLAQAEKAPSAKTLKDSFQLLDSEGAKAGKISIYVRMSCFGKLIVTQFQMNSRDQSVLFKDKGGQSCYRYKKAAKDENLQDEAPDAGFAEEQADVFGATPSPFGTMIRNYSAPQRAPFQDMYRSNHNPPTWMMGPMLTPNIRPLPASTHTPGGFVLPFGMGPNLAPSPMEMNMPQPVEMGMLPPNEMGMPGPMQMPPMNQLPCSECNMMMEMGNMGPDQMGPFGMDGGQFLTPCEECGTLLPPQFKSEISPRVGMPPPDPPGNYQEIGASMGGNALTIRVHKDKNKVEQVDEFGVASEGSCSCTPGNLGGPKQKKGPASGGQQQQQYDMFPGVPQGNLPFSLKVSGAGEQTNNNVVVNPPVSTRPDGTKFTEISDPNKEMFVLRIGKKSEGVQKKANLELELCTPRGPDLKPLPKKETRDTQYDPADCAGGKKEPGGKKGKKDKKDKGGKKKGGKGKKKK